MAGIVGAVGSLFVAVPRFFLLAVCISAVGAALTALLIARRRGVVVGLTYFTVACIVCLRGSSDIARYERASFVAQDPDTAAVHCRGVVIWKEESGHSGRVTRLLLSNLKLTLPDTTLYVGKLYLRLNVPANIADQCEIGDVIACEARIQSAEYYQRRTVRELCWTLRDRLIGTAKLAGDESFVVVHGTYNMRRATYDIRNKIFGVFEQYLRPDARAVAGALLLGSRTAFSTDFRNDLQTTGLAHLFALSGLNTGLLVSLFWLVLGWLRIPRRLRYLVLLMLLAFYTALGLGVPSLLRSSVMAALLITSRLLARPNHPLNLLLFAAGLELLVWPLHILDAGFHLSYLSMAGILAAYLALHKPIQDIVHIRNTSLAGRTVETLTSTLGAQLATAPSVALMFGRVPGLAIVANVIAIPIFSLLLVLILVLLLLAPLNDFLASAFARSIEALVSVFAVVTSVAAKVVGASFASLQHWFWTALAIVTQLAGIVFAFVGRGKIALTFALIAVNLLLWPSRFVSEPTARITSIGADGAECYLVHFGEINLLMGSGPEWEAERRAYQVTDALQSIGAARLNMLVAFDRKATDIGAAPAIIDAAKPELVLDFALPRDTRTSDRLDAACLLAGAKLLSGRVGEMWNVENTRVEIVDMDAQAKRFTIELTEGIECLRISYNGVQIENIEHSVTFHDCHLSAPLEFSASIRSWTKKENTWHGEAPKALELARLMSLPTGPKV